MIQLMRDLKWKYGGARTSQDTNKVLDRHLITTIIDFNVVAVQIKVPPRVGIDASGKLISRITSSVICQHEDDIRVGDA